MCDKLIKVTSLILNITRIAIYTHTHAYYNNITPSKLL